MSQPSTQTSPTKTSPQKPSPSKSTTTTPNITENPSVPLPQPSDVITNATPFTMIHPSFNSILNPTPSNPSPSPKSKPTKNTKSVTTRKPKSQKSKSRYSSNLDMQQLYLSDLGNARTNVASDVATPCPDAQIEANKEDSTQTLSPKKGETAKMGEQYVPNTPSDEGDDEDAQNIKIAEDALKSLVDSVSGVKVVPDVPTSLAQDQPQDDVMDDSNVQQNDDIATDVTGDPSVQPDEIVADDVLAKDTDQVDDTEEEGVNEDDSTDEDVTILEIVGESKKRSGKTGVGNRLRTRKEKVTEVVVEEPKSTKKKKVAAEATKSPKKKKVAAEATTSTKNKMYGPVRRSSRVEIPAKQKKKASKRKTIELSDSEVDAEEDAPPIPTASKQKTPKRRKTVVDAAVDDAEENAPSIVSAKKKKAGRSIPQNVPDVPMDNVSFHFSASAAKWKFVYHRRLALERELSDEALECKEVIDLIHQAGLMKTVSGLGKCYEKLVKEFTVNIGEDCGNRLSKEFHQVFVRGKCVDFSPALINRFLGRNEEGYSEFEPTNNQICKTITANQVKV
ncbi:hypothetical protein QL285_086630 [Trifolium repens]|nr:hypothetical protein QL285_086630 [Trifolium repens]